MSTDELAPFSLSVCALLARSHPPRSTPHPPRPLAIFAPPSSLLTLFAPHPHLPTSHTPHATHATHHTLHATHHTPHTTPHTTPHHTTHQHPTFRTTHPIPHLNPLHPTSPEPNPTLPWPLTGNVRHDVLVPLSFCSRLIGAGGSTMKRLQQRTGGRMFIFQRIAPPGQPEELR